MSVSQPTLSDEFVNGQEYEGQYEEIERQIREGEEKERLKKRETKCYYQKTYICGSDWFTMADCPYYDGYVSPTDNKVLRGAKCKHAEQVPWAGLICTSKDAQKGSMERNRFQDP